VPAYLAFSEVFGEDHTARDGWALGVFPRYCVEFPPRTEAPAKYRGHRGSARRVRAASLLVSIHLGTTFLVVVWPLDCHPVYEALGRLRRGRVLYHRYSAAWDKSEKVYAREECGAAAD
jgi:hypothetical protein